ncbi:MAG: hypothetical protein KatS3mg100_042 [Candidatus Parcubacteria bacterium]|nr:MAG: hypothetical protein KatS3mg100_042 [Candidatus Parcubacteria bacterium]
MAFWAGISARVSSLEPLFSWGAFLGGVVWDALTLDRIDRPGSQLTLVVLWGVVVTCLLLIVLVRSEGKWAERLRWAAALGAQFGLGGLFSALSIFFVRSASWGSSALFVLHHCCPSRRERIFSGSTTATLFLSLQCGALRQAR